MGGRHLPQGYVETGRWSLKQATPRRYPARNRRGPERADRAAHPEKPPGAGQTTRM